MNDFLRSSMFVCQRKNQACNDILTKRNVNMKTIKKVIKTIIEVMTAPEEENALPYFNKLELFIIEPSTRYQEEPLDGFFFACWSPCILYKGLAKRKKTGLCD